MSLSHDSRGLVEAAVITSTTGDDVWVARMLRSLVNGAMVGMTLNKRAGAPAEASWELDPITDGGKLVGGVIRPTSGSAAPWTVRILNDPATGKLVGMTMESTT
jgi:hypothetical protein